MPIDYGNLCEKPKNRPLQFKRGSAHAFRKANPILLNGEPAYEWDTKKMKVGDGKTRYMTSAIIENLRMENLLIRFGLMKEILVQSMIS